MEQSLHNRHEGRTYNIVSRGNNKGTAKYIYNLSMGLYKFFLTMLKKHFRSDNVYVMELTLFDNN